MLHFSTWTAPAELIMTPLPSIVSAFGIVTAPNSPDVSTTTVPPGLTAATAPANVLHGASRGPQVRESLPNGVTKTLAESAWRGVEAAATSTQRARNRRAVIRLRTLTSFYCWCEAYLGLGSGRGGSAVWCDAGLRAAAPAFNPR